MRTLTLVAAAAIAVGCGRSNPFRPTSEMARLAEQEEIVVQRERDLVKPRELPQHRDPPPAPPNLDTWKATVLEKATRETLARMKRDEEARAAYWRAQVAEHRAGNTHVHHVAYVDSSWELAIVEAKLKLINARRADE